MKTYIKKIAILVAVGFMSLAPIAEAQFFVDSGFSAQGFTSPASVQAQVAGFASDQDFINFLIQQLNQLRAQLNQELSQQVNTFSPQPFNNGGFVFTPVPADRFSGSNNISTNRRGDRRPDADIERADDVDEDSAELRGEIDMNDFRDGIVFFVYGQDEGMIEDVQRDYDEFDEVEDDEENDDFEVLRVDTNLDGREDYDERVTGLEEDEEYFYIICVEYEDEDNDERLECSSVEDFETDDEDSSDNNNSNDDEPEAETVSALNVRERSARIRGEIDMNDFDDGLVFFAWGEDERDVEDVEDENRFDDIDENGDDLQVQIVEDRLSGFDQFSLLVTSLNNNTDYYYRICVEYQDGSRDRIECGDVEDFETDR